MIWLCGIVEINILCAPNRNFLCTIPALTTSFRKMCGPRYPWRNSHVSLKEKHYITICGLLLFWKISSRKIFTIRVTGSVSCNSAAAEKKPSLIRCPEDTVLEVLRSTQNLQQYFLVSWQSSYQNYMVMWYCGDRHLLYSQPKLFAHHSCSNNLV
jgi:hypothetical protein